MSTSLAARVAVLETQVRSLLQLPDRVSALEAHVASLDSQFLQFRAEVKAEFLATRNEIKALGQELREELRKEIHDGDESLRQEMQLLRGEIEETRRFMLVLHEEVIGRIKVLGEQWRG
ncbi:MAG: hypothetical protein AB7F99_06275 [Vicinamibacterales bacterium]